MVFFMGALPVFWAGDKAKSVSESKLETPFWFLDLQQAKYRMEIRTVCDLSYRNMGSTSFGTNQGGYLKFTSNRLREISIGKITMIRFQQREKAAFTSAMEALKVAPSGGNFHFIALDSTHYGYRWHEDFEPPYSDFSR